MLFSVNHNNGLWKIDISNSFLPENEHPLEAEKILNKNCKIKSVFLKNTTWSFDNVSIFADACVMLRNLGFFQE